MKVSVITTTYNHPPEMLQRAMDSVTMQKGVDFEHIVIDDTITNNGMMETYRTALNRCKGEYIAFCDGDDYWINSYKLYEQVRFMDKHKDISLCTTKVITKTNKKRTLMGVSTSFINRNMSFDNLLKGNAFIYAPSYLIRKSDFDKYIDFNKFMKFNVWDYPIVLELIKHTRFHCLGFYSAVFTKNTESVTQTRSRKRRLKYVIGNHKIKWYYILKYGCEPKTLVYLLYKFTRDMYSVIFKTWT